MPRRTTTRTSYAGCARCRAKVFSAPLHRENEGLQLRHAVPARQYTEGGTYDASRFTPVLERLCPSSLPARPFLLDVRPGTRVLGWRVKTL